MSKTFGATSTTDEVLEGVDLSGKRVLVTGVSAGLGVETARALAAHGAQVVGAARDLDKAQRRDRSRARGRGATAAGSSSSSSTSPRSPACAPAPTRWSPAGKPFDVVIANAGVMATPKGKTADGFETQFGTNHLGHFVFVNRIAPLLQAGRAAGESVLGRPPLLRRRSRRSELRAHALHRVRRLWPLEDGEHPVRGRVRPPPQGARRPRDGRASRRHPDRTRPPHDAGSPSTADRGDQREPARGRARLRVQDHSARRRDLRLGGVVAPADAVGGRYCEDCHVAEIVERPDMRAAACAPTRSIPSAPRRCGRRARRWSASGSHSWISIPVCGKTTNCTCPSKVYSLIGQPIGRDLTKARTGHRSTASRERSSPP